MGLLESPVIHWSGEESAKPSYYILNFYYYMHGAGVDGLHVATHRMDETGWTIIWTARGDQGKRWIFEQVVLFTNVVDFKVGIEGERKYEEYGFYFPPDPAYIASKRFI